MAKSDRPYKHIAVSKAFTPPRTPTFGTDKPIHGFDTETADGSVFALSYAFQDAPGQVIHDKAMLSGHDIFNVLTHKQCRSAINVWYNLNFDANAVLNHILDASQWAEIVVTGTTHVTVQNMDYEITYIPSKFLKIKDEHRHAYTHYDVSQFCYGSLDDASREWLDASKADENIDTTKFGADDGSINHYLQERYHDVIKYAKQDAELVRDLWDAMTQEGENLDIPMGKPFSTGYLAESFLNNRFDYKPGIGKDEVAAIAWDAFNGGRFEVFKRGDVGPVAGPDINSAYPYIHSELPDPATLHWRHPTNPDMNMIRQADYGFIEADLTTYKDKPIQPFTLKDETQTVFYPRLYDYNTTTLKDTFVFAHDNEYIKDYEIRNCWLGTAHASTKYPFQFIRDLYDERKAYERDGYDKKGQLLKIVLNSMYGKTCQTTPKATPVESLEREIRKADDGDSYTEFVMTDMQLPDAIQAGYPSGIVEWLESGSWFNPFISSYITGLTRLELHKRMRQYGLEDSTIMFATDSIMVERDAFEKSDFADDLVSPELGMWDYDYQGRGFVVGAGVYEVEFSDCIQKSCPDYNTARCTHANHYVKTKTRGFNESALFDSWDTLKDAAHDSHEEIPIETTRPRTAAELLWRNESLDMVSQFDSATRKLSANFDTKRQWPSNVDYKALLAGRQASRPRELRA